MRSKIPHYFLRHHCSNFREKGQPWQFSLFLWFFWSLKAFDWAFALKAVGQWKKIWCEETSLPLPKICGNDKKAKEKDRKRPDSLTFAARKWPLRDPGEKAKPWKRLKILCFAKKLLVAPNIFCATNSLFTYQFQEAKNFFSPPRTVSKSFKVFLLNSLVLKSCLCLAKKGVSRNQPDKLASLSFVRKTSSAHFS